MLAKVLLCGSLALVAMTQAPVPVARLLTNPVDDVLLPTSSVSGPLLAGVMLAASNEAPAAGNPWLSIPGRSTPGRMCVTVQSADGRYRARLDYEVPAGDGSAPVVLPFETEIKHRTHVAALGRDQVAVLAVPDRCDAAPPATARAATWREPRTAQVRRLRVAVITGGRDTRMTWDATGAAGPLKGAGDCRSVNGTAFDAWCEADLPADARGELRAVMTPFTLVGRKLDPITVTVVLGR